MNKTRLIIFVVIVVLAYIIYSSFNKADDESEVPKVPLGIEHAITISYNGPELAVKPYKFGVPVNIRIAKVQKMEDTTFYDIRYMLNAGGEFDVTEYLTAKDGSSLSGLPQFKVFGLEKLSQEMDTRIQQVEEMGVDIWPYYYETLSAVIALWVIWLFLLIFYGRPPKEQEIEPIPVETFQEKLINYIKTIEEETIDNDSKAKLEALILSWFKEQLGKNSISMNQALSEMKKDNFCSDALQKVESWIHNPNSNISNKDIVEALKLYTVKHKEELV